MSPFAWRAVALGSLAIAAASACSLLTPLDSLGGDGGGACEAGRTSCSGACVDVATDGHNCGRCGHDCFGGGCTGGACLPATIASGQDSPFGIAVDSQRVYWANNDVDASFAACPLTGCGEAGVTTLLDQQSLPADVFVTNGHLYMTTYGYWGDGGTGGTVLACDPNACQSTLVKLAGVPPSNPVAVVADTTTVYWTNNASGVIGSCAATGCSTPTTFATDRPRGPWYGLALASGSLYWTSQAPDAGAVYSCPTAGCTQPSLIAPSDGQPFDLSVFDGNVYWTNDAGGQVLRCPVTGCGGNAPLVIADNQSKPSGVAADASGVYWLNRAGGTVLRCDLDGCGASGPTLLAGGQNQPWEIVLDDTSVYWTSSGDGKILRLAKP